MKKIAILGSTGSIGTQTLEVIRENKDIEVTGLAAGTNVDLLEKQIREFQPKLVAMWTEEKAKELKSRIRDLDVKVVSGMDGLLEIATMEESEILVTAIVGMIGIRPTIAAIKAGKDIALANKETLVTAGHIIMPLAKECGVKILPVDSEHSAIFQSLQGSHGKNELKKILLTASGGPFRGKKQEDLLNIRVEDALKHPNWAMGRKITIDSSTMVNKGLEVMEARWLFNVDIDDVQVVVQPQSVIHSMVEYVDGAVHSLERRICVCRSSMHFIIRKEDFFRENVWISGVSDTLILKSRIWIPSTGLHLLTRQGDAVEHFQRYLTQQMNLQSASS